MENFTREQNQAVAKTVMEAKLKVIEDFMRYIKSVSSIDDESVVENWLDDSYKFFKSSVIAGNQTKMVNEFVEDYGSGDSADKE